MNKKGKSIPIVFFLLLSCLYPADQLLAQTGRLSTQIGSIIRSARSSNSISFVLSNAYATLTPYGPSTVRVRVSREKPGGDQSFAIDQLQSSSTFKTIKEEPGSWVLLTDSLEVLVNKNPFRLSFYDLQGHLLNEDDSTLGISWWGQQVSNYKKLFSNEKFIGLGEKSGPLNRRGQFYRNWNSDIFGYGLEQDPLYSTLPFFIGIHDSLSYGIFFDNTHQSYFNFGGGSNEELMHFGADDGEMNYYFFQGSIPAIIEEYTILTGRVPLPPLWSLGYQQCRWGYASSDELLDIARTLRAKKLPSDVVYMDILYLDGYKVFTWDPVNFSNPRKMMDELKRMNFDLVTIVDPGIKIEKGYKPYDEGVANHHFASYPGGKLYAGTVWPGAVHFPDFTKPATRQWWGDNFKSSLVDIGVRGFWNDMNEPAGWGREFPNLIEFGDPGNKKTLYTVKNVYGLLMSKATYEGTRRLMNGQRPFVLTRAAYSGVQKYSAQWTGDNTASDEHMLLGQRLINSMALCGVSYVGMDIGGFTGRPSPELYVRWMNLGVYAPLMRQHSMQGSPRSEPWNFGEFNLNFVRSLLEQRYRLLPYLYSSFYQAHQSGMPVNRMLPVFYTHDEKVYDTKYENEFLFGDFMLVCPVNSKTLTAEVYLPGNTDWYRWNSDEIYSGGRTDYVPSPLDNLPVFVKAGAIIPQQSVVQSTKEKGDGILYLHIWKGKTKTRFTYYEDDGATYDYEKNGYYKRTIEYDALNGKISFGQKEGDYRSKFSKLQLVLHGFDSRPGVSLNGETVNISASGKNFILELMNRDETLELLLR